MTVSDFTPDVIGVCKLKFVYFLKSSPGAVASSWEQSAHFSWGVALSSGKCKTVWMICKDCSNVNSYFCFGSQIFQHHGKKHIGGTPEKSKQSSSVMKKEVVGSNITGGSDTLLKVDTASAGVSLLHASNNDVDGSTTLLVVESKSPGAALFDASNNLVDCSNTFNVADALLGVGNSSVSASSNLLEVSTSVMGGGTASASDSTALEMLLMLQMLLHPC